jgi:dihydroorotase
LVLKNIFPLEGLIELLTKKPAENFNLPYGKIEQGASADIVLLDLNETHIIEPNEFLSKGKNTPFSGWKCKGWPVMTISKGKIAWDKGCAAE